MYIEYDRTLYNIDLICILGLALELINRYTYTYTDIQEAQRSQRDRATQYVSWNIVDCCRAVRIITFETACSRWKTLKVTQCHRNCRYSMGHTSVIVYLQRFRDITTFTAHVTACNHKVRSLSPSFTKWQLKLQAMCAFWFTCKRMIDNT